MRIVAIGDTHTYQDDLGQLSPGDVLIHVGDLCQGGTLEELVPVVTWLQSQSHQHKIVIAGNHDWCFTRNKEEALKLLGDSIIYLEDSSVVIDEVTFWGAPWQPEFSYWAFNLPRGKPLAEKWALIPETTDILLTHGPPLGIGDRYTDEERNGCADLLEAVERVQPAVHLFGHIHQDGGLWQKEKTCFANVTTWESCRPETIFDYDPATKKVFPVQVPARRNF